jgi:MFS family permease
MKDALGPEQARPCAARARARLAAMPTAVDRASSGGTPGSIHGGLAFALALAMLMPVTLPVAVLPDLVGARFAVSEAAAARFNSINMLAALACGPVAGWLCDRLRRPRPYIAGLLLLDAACFAALCLPMDYGTFLAVRALEGGAHASALALVMGLAARSRRGAARGKLLGALGAGLTLGVALGAGLGGQVGRQDPLRTLQLAAALCVGCALLALWGMPRRVEPAAPEPGEVQRSPHSHERTARERPPGRFAIWRRLALPLAFGFADRFTVGFYTTTFAFYLQRMHGLPAPRIGLLLALFLLPFALLSYPCGLWAERGSRAALVCGGSLLYGLATAALTFVPLPLLPYWMVGLGVFSAVMFVPSIQLTTDLAPAHLRGAAMGAFNAAGSLGFVLGPLVGGHLSESVAAAHGWSAGYGAAFALAGGSEVALALIAWPLLLRMRANALAAGKARGA